MMQLFTRGLDKIKDMTVILMVSTLAFSLFLKNATNMKVRE
jgi:hypothetical protein